MELATVVGSVSAYVETDAMLLWMKWALYMYCMGLNET